MSSFAKIGLNGKVIEVQSVVNEVLHDSNGVEQESIGIDFLTKLTGWSIWKQTSYNTFAGEHKLGGTPFRKNHASVGYTYDEERDAFIPPKEYPSWTLNETTCRWDPPTPKPVDDNTYMWNEEDQTWDIVE
jgi:hypothetical protein|tara:strand:+ start:270 stop:662 length:393 start_codon:yes stop_codon:yes gene_type:complete